MADEILRTLVTELKLSAASWNNDIKAAQREAKAFSTEWKASLGVMKDVGIGLAAIGTAITGTMLAATKSAVDFADSLNDLRQKTGVSVDNLSKLAFAAEQSGSSIEGISTGLKFLAKNMEGAIAASGTQRAAFNALGISSKDLKAAGGDVNAVFLLVADRLKGIEDPAKKSTLAMDIFGRSGQDLIPVLNEGSAGIQKLGADAAAAGKVIGQDFATASDKLNDTLHEAETALGGVSVQIATALLPALQTAAEYAVAGISAFANFTKEHQGLTEATFATGAALLATGTALVSIGVVIPKVIAGWGLLTTALGAVGVTLTAATAGVAALGAAIGVAVGSLINWGIEGTKVQGWLDGFVDGTLKKLGFQWDSTSEAQKSAAFTAAGVAKVQADGLPHIEATTKAVAAHKAIVEVDASAMEKQRDELEKVVQKFRESQDAIAAHNVFLAQSKTAMDRATTASQGLRDAIIAQALAAGEAAADTAYLNLVIAKAVGSTDMLTASQRASIGVIQEIDNANFEASQNAADYHKQITDQLKAETEAGKKNAEALKQATQDVKDSAGHIFDDMFIKGESVFSSLQNALKGGALSLGRSIFEDVAGALLGPVKKAFDDFFIGLLEGSGIKSFVTGLGNKLGGLLGGIFGGRDVGAAVASGASGVAGAGTSAASSATGAASSLTTSIISAVGGVVGGIISALGTARLEGTMNAVEANTRFTYIEIKDMFGVLDVTNFTLSAMNQSLTWINMAIDQTNAILAGGAGAAVATTETAATNAAVGTTTTTNTTTTTTAPAGTVFTPTTLNQGGDPGGLQLDRNGYAAGIDPLTGRPLPVYAVGTNYVPRTGPAIVHQGEAIIPAGQSGGGTTVNINFSGNVYGMEDFESYVVNMLYDATRNRRVQIAGAR